MADYTAFGQTELGDHIPTILVESANQGLGYLRKYLNLGRTVRKDFSGDFSYKGATLNIPKRGSLSVNDKTTKENVTKQAPSDDKVSITLNKHKEVTFLIEDVAQAVSIPAVLEGYSRDAVAVIAEQIEQDLADLYASAGTTLTKSDFSSWRDVFRRARRILITEKIGKFDPMMAQLDEYAVETILGETNIEDASKFGNNRPLLDGSVEKLAGVSLFESQVVGIDTSTSPDTYYPMVYGPEAMVLAVRPLPDWGNDRGVAQTTVFDEEAGLAIRATIGYDNNALGLQVTFDVLYGVGVARSEHLITVAHQPSVDS
jgi:hypothetical protein